jgi:ATP adenylyltransferase
MDYLFSPWRYAYITSDEPPAGACIFCDKPKEAEAASDARNYIVHRGKECFIILNAFPYTSGHVMVVPYQHADELQKISNGAAAEMMALTQKMEGVLRRLYRPEGLNVGMNIGKAAGAGIAGHIHMHILPRWTADANFVSVIGETRVLPEALDVTYKRIKEALG